MANGRHGRQTRERGQARARERRVSPPLWLHARTISGGTAAALCEPRRRRHRHRRPSPAARRRRRCRASTDPAAARGFTRDETAQGPYDCSRTGTAARRRRPGARSIGNNAAAASGVSTITELTMPHKHNRQRSCAGFSFRSQDPDLRRRPRPEAGTIGRQRTPAEIQAKRHCTTSWHCTVAYALSANDLLRIQVSQRSVQNNADDAPFLSTRPSILLSRHHAITVRLIISSSCTRRGCSSIAVAANARDRDGALHDSSWRR